MGTPPLGPELANTGINVAAPPPYGSFPQAPPKAMKQQSPLTSNGGGDAELKLMKKQQEPLPSLASNGGGATEPMDLS